MQDIVRLQIHVDRAAKAAQELASRVRKGLIQDWASEALEGHAAVGFRFLKSSHGLLDKGSTGGDKKGKATHSAAGACAIRVGW